MLGVNYEKENNKNGIKVKEEKKEQDNLFLRNQRKALEEKDKKKKEKHLFRVNEFKDKEGVSYRPLEEDIPYGRIDLIFNAKNMWANFQNPSPNYIHYNLHRRTQWCPFIVQDNEQENQKKEKDKSKSGSSDSDSDGNAPYNFIETDDELSSKKNKEEQDAGPAEDEDEFSYFKGMDAKEMNKIFQERGNYMREFSPFYELISMERIYTDDEIFEKVNDIIETVEMGLRSIRSVKNLNTKLKRDPVIIKKFENYLNLLEDEALGSFSEADISQMKSQSMIEIRKLVPQNYKIEMMPCHFTYLDSERIKTCLMEEQHEFMMKTPSKVVWAVWCKIYNYHCGVVWVRIMIAKMHKITVVTKTTNL